MSLSLLLLHAAPTSRSTSWQP